MMHNCIVPHRAPVDMPKKHKLEVLWNSLPVLWKKGQEAVVEYSIIPAHHTQASPATWLCFAPAHTTQRDVCNVRPCNRQCEKRISRHFSGEYLNSQVHKHMQLA